jgi:hypothetical protein
VLKLKYSFKMSALRVNEKGKTFDYILGINFVCNNKNIINNYLNYVLLGTTYTALELFILKRKLKGP